MGEAFGGVNINRFFKAAEGWPGIAEVRKEPEQKANIGGEWHTDHTYDTEPALGSILAAREVPPFGGDTQFSSMYAAYDALSYGLKAMLCGMKAVHSSRHVFGPRANHVRDGSDIGDRLGNNEAATQDAVHPVVIRHPVSGPALALCQPRLHRALRRLDGGRKPPAAANALRAWQPAGVHLPGAFRAGHGGLLGQPRDLALRTQRLCRPPPPDAPRHRGRRPAPGLAARIAGARRRLSDSRSGTTSPASSALRASVSAAHPVPAQSQAARGGRDISNGVDIAAGHQAEAWCPGRRAG